MTSQNAYNLIYQITENVALNRADSRSIETAFDTLKLLVDADMTPKDGGSDKPEAEPTQPEQPAESAPDEPENKDVESSVAADVQPQTPVDGPAASQGPVNL